MRDFTVCSLLFWVSQGGITRQISFTLFIAIFLPISALDALDLLQVPLVTNPERPGHLLSHTLNWMNTGYPGSESHKEEVNKRYKTLRSSIMCSESDLFNLD